VEYRKRLLLSFAWIGSLATALYLFLPTARHGSVYLAVVLSIIAVACFGDSFVCLNAYLGQLVRDDPEVMASAALVSRPGSERPGPVEPLVHSYDDQEDVSLLAAAAEALDPDLSTNKHMLEEQSRLTEEAHIATVSLVTTRTSSMGIAIGYAAGVAMLCLSVIPVAQSQGSLESLSTVIGVTGLWWAIFTFPAATWLPTTRNRTSDNSAERHEQISADPLLSEHATSPVNVKSKVAEGWKRVAQVFNKQELRRLSQLYWFLFSWALLADGKPIPSVNWYIGPWLNLTGDAHHSVQYHDLGSHSVCQDDLADVGAKDNRSRCPYSVYGHIFCHDDAARASQTWNLRQIAPGRQRFGSCGHVRMGSDCLERRVRDVLRGGVVRSGKSVAGHRR